LLDAAGSTSLTLARREQGGYRIRTILPQGIAPEAELTVLAVLEESDRFGHHYRPEEQSVWLEVH
jgi:hypothetical protein